MSEIHKTQDAPVLSYVLGSADMRHGGIAERDIYLHKDAKNTWLFQGRISGCGSDCFIDLSQILLEYAMSCEGCGDQSVASKEAARFGKQLAELLIAKIKDEIAELTTQEQLKIALEIILHSMNAAFSEDEADRHLAYSIDCCPLSECGKRVGLSSSTHIAGLAFITLCQQIIQSLAPDWRLLQPDQKENCLPLHKILIENPKHKTSIGSSLKI